MTRRNTYLNALKLYKDEVAAKRAIIAAHTIPTEVDNYVLRKTAQEVSPNTYKIESPLLKTGHKEVSFGTYEIIYKLVGTSFHIFHRVFKPVNQDNFKDFFKIDELKKETPDDELLDDERQAEEASWQPVKGEWTEDTTNPSFVLLTHATTQEKIYIVE